MKRIVFILIAVALIVLLMVFTGCKKEDVKPETQTTNTIIPPVKDTMDAMSGTYGLNRKWIPDSLTFDFEYNQCTVVDYVKGVVVSTYIYPYKVSGTKECFFIDVNPGPTVYQITQCYLTSTNILCRYTNNDGSSYPNLTLYKIK